MLDPKHLPEKELSEESCELEAAAVLPESCLQNLVSSNWKERISCLEALEKAVAEMEKSQLPCQALVRLLDKDPGWKETKLQVMQKKLHIVTLIAQRGNFSKTSALFVLGNLVDKIGDVICGGDTKEALTAVAEACGLPWTAGKVAEVAFSQDSPRTHSETLNWLTGAIQDFGFDGMEAKLFVGYIKFALSAAHPDVRTSAFSLLKVMYLYTGPPLRAFFEDEKPPLLSQIDAEFEKVTGQRPPPPSRGLCNLCQEERNEQRGGDAQCCLRNSTVDISKRISSELILKMHSKNWKIRKEGLEEVARILSDVNSIQPNLGDLSLALRSCLHDSNKALVKQTLDILQQLAGVMGPGIRQHVKTLGMSIINVLRDSKSNLRSVALATVEVWAQQTGMKEWFEEDILTDVKKESQRQGLLGWLAERLPPPTSISSDLLRCVPHLYSTLEDPHEEKRMAAHEALPFFMLHLGLDKMSEAAGRLKPSSRDQVLAVLEKAKGCQPAKPTARFAKPLSKLPRGKSWHQPSSDSPEQGNQASSPTSEPSLDVKQTKLERAVQKTKKAPGVKVQPKLHIKDNSSNLGPIFIIVPKAKEQRMKDEKALKVLRWNFSSPSSKYIEQLKVQMSGCLSNWLQEELFHSNFQHHIKALTVMTEHLESEKEGVISCLDLVLKWLSLRLFDTNTWVLTKTLEYLKRLFSLLIEEKYQLLENEVSSFLPYLLQKMGGTKESILKEVRAIVKQTTMIYPTCKTFCLLLEGAKTKNPNQRMGCLKELEWMLRTYGREVCQRNPGKALKTIIAFTGDSNNAVHNTALRVIATARDVYGAEAFKAIGNISEKHMSLLEDSIREIEGRQGKDDKVGIQVFTESTEGSKQNNGSSHQTEEEYSCLHQNQVEMENAQKTAFCGDLKPADGVPHGLSLESPAENSISSNINMIICHVASGNTSTSIEALAQIQAILGQEDKAQAMSGHINPFLIAALRQLKYIHRLHLTAEEEVGKEVIIQLYGALICSMISLFQVESLAQEASAGVLKDLMNTLITLLLDSPVEECQEEQEVTPSVNLLITKVIENSDQTRILSTLFVLLHEGLTANSNLLGFSELVAKCLWKITKFLPQTIGSISLNHVLLDIHIFMRAIPKEKLKQYQSNYPYRALRTLLHTLCKLKGDKILDHLSLIENRDESELEVHLQKVVKHLAVQAGQDGESEDLSSCPAEDQVSSALEAVFKKINNKETARAGLEELYEYKKKHPQADLEPFLKNCSLLFRSYVKHGLAVIGSERENKQKNSFSTEKAP